MEDKKKLIAHLKDVEPVALPVAEHLDEAAADVIRALGALSFDAREKWTTYARQE